LATFEIREETQNKDKTNCTPIDDGSIGFPKMFTFDLLTTMRTKTRFVFQNRPVWGSFAAKTPYGRKYFHPTWYCISMGELNSVGLQQIRNFLLHI
jgi:hypothetical protein